MNHATSRNGAIRFRATVQLGSRTNIDEAVSTPPEGRT